MEAISTDVNQGAMGVDLPEPIPCIEKPDMTEPIDHDGRPGVGHCRRRCPKHHSDGQAQHAFCHLTNLHRSGLIGVMPARHRAFTGEVRPTLIVLARRATSCRLTIRRHSSGQGQHVFEEDLVTGIHVLGNGRAVYPEARERERPGSFLYDPVPRGRCVDEKRELEEVPLVYLALPIGGVVVDYTESPWSAELGESGFLSSLPKHAIHRILTFDKRATRELRAESGRLPGPEEEDPSVPCDVCDRLSNDAQCYSPMGAVSQLFPPQSWRWTWSGFPRGGSRSSSRRYSCSSRWRSFT